MKKFALLALLCCVKVADAASVVPIIPVIQESRAQYYSQFTFSPDGQWIVSGDTPQLWSARGELVRNLEFPRFGGSTPIFAPDGTRLFLTVKNSLEWQDGTAVYQMPSGRKIAEIKGVEVSDDARFFIRRGEKTTRISEIQSGKLLAKIPLNTTELPLSFSPDGKFVAIGETPSAYRDGKMRIWNLQNGKLERILSDKRAISGSALWSVDGKTLVTTGGPKDGRDSDSVAIWNWKTGELRQNWTNIGVKSDDFYLHDWVSPNEIVMGAERNITLDIATGKVRQDFKYPIANGPQIVLSEPSFNAFELRDASGARVLQRFPLRGFANHNMLAHSPDGELLVASQAYSDIHVYDAHSGALIQTLQAPEAPEAPTRYSSLRWSADGTLRVTSGADEWIWQRDEMRLSEVATRLPLLANFPQQAQRSPGGKWAFDYLQTPSGIKSYDTNVRIWNRKGEITRQFPIVSNQNHAGKWNYSRNLVWIDDARLAVPTSAGAEVWNAESGRETFIEKSPDAESITPVITSPDGQFLLCREARGEYGSKRWNTVLLETRNWTRAGFYPDSAPLAWNADSSKFIAQGNEGENVAYLFAPRENKPLRKMSFQTPTHGGGDEISFSPDLTWVAMKRERRLPVRAAREQAVAQNELSNSDTRRRR